MLYNYPFSYVINLININKAKKSLFFDIIFTHKTFLYIKVLFSLNYVFRYQIIKKNQRTYLRVYVTYWNLKNVGYNFKLISKPSHSFYISLKALKLLKKRTGNSIFLISNSFGILSYDDALKKKTGGMLLGFFTI